MLAIALVPTTATAAASTVPDPHLSVPARFGGRVPFSPEGGLRGRPLADHPSRTLRATDASQPRSVPIAIRSPPQAPLEPPTHSSSTSDEEASRNDVPAKERGLDLDGDGTVDIIADEESNPRTFPGIRRFRMVLFFVIAAASSFVTVPFAINTVALMNLRSSIAISASSGRREVLIFNIASYIADMEGATNCGATSVRPEIDANVPISMEDLLGELQHVHHALTFCGSGHQILDSYREFVDVTKLSCKNGLKPSLSGITASTAYDIKTATNDTTGEVGPTIFESVKLVDDQIQTLIYVFDALRTNVTAFGLPRVLSQELFDVLVGSENATDTCFVDPVTIPIAPGVSRTVMMPLLPFELISSTLEQYLTALFNIPNLARGARKVSKQLEDEVTANDQSFFVGLIFVVIIFALLYASIPFIMAVGLRSAHFEKHIGFYILDAVPVPAIRAVLRRMEEEDDEVTEAIDLKRSASFDDIDAHDGAKKTASPDGGKGRARRRISILADAKTRPGSFLSEVLNVVMKREAAFLAVACDEPPKKGKERRFSLNQGPAAAAVQVAPIGSPLNAGALASPNTRAPPDSIGSPVASERRGSCDAGALSARRRSLDEIPMRRVVSDDIESVMQSDGGSFAGTSFRQGNPTAGLALTSAGPIHKGYVNGRLRVFDPIEEVKERLWAKAVEDPTFRSVLKNMFLMSGVLFAAALAMSITLPIIYSETTMILKQFRVMEEYVRFFAETGWQTARLTPFIMDRYTWGNLPATDLAQNFEPWYKFGADNAVFPQTILLSMADRGELLHRCIIYGCSELDIEGVSTSQTIADFFFRDGVDQGFKSYISSLRNRGYLYPTYATQGYYLIRTLPRLYSDNFNTWAGNYQLILSIGCAVVLAATLFVAFGYYTKYVRRFATEVRNYRFVLGLLPPDTLRNIPFAVSYMKTTEWVEESRQLIDSAEVDEDEEEDL